MIVAHPFNPNTWEAEAGDPCEFNASLIYRVSSRTAKATQKDPVPKEKKIPGSFRLGWLWWSGLASPGLRMYPDSQRLL